jgi:biopolymer transport protein ExbB/TolQ
MNHSIDSQALDLMLRAGSRWVLWLLIGLSIAAAAVVLERLWFFARSRRQRQQVVDMLAALRKSGPEAARKALGEARSIEATVARACLDHIADGALAIEEHIAAVVETDRLHYERGLAFLGTLGSNAPFVGLFGTVLGIVRAFHDLSTSAAMGSQAVMAGIAEALVATAIGLLVALPAVATYNALMRHVETAMAAANAVGHQILAYVKAQKPEVAGSSGAREAK